METTPPKPKVMMEGYLNKKGAGTGILGTGVGGMFVGHLYLFNFIIYFFAIPVLAFFTKAGQTGRNDGSYLKMPIYIIMKTSIPMRTEAMVCLGTKKVLCRFTMR